MKNRTRLTLGSLCAAVLGSVLAQPASAATVEYWLRAQEVNRNIAQPSGVVPVTVWQYRSCQANFAGPCVPLNNGGVLRAAEGDTLVVHLQNLLRRGSTLISLPGVAAYGNLPVPTSMMIPGLAPPTFQSGPTAAGACPTTTAAPVEIAGGGRIRSFTSEVANVQAAAAAVGTYCWSNLKAGTHLYQSGTHPAVQVQMGLHGALVVEGTAGSCGAGPHCAYPGVAYDREVVAVYSEIDPRLHAKVADSSYGDATAADPLLSTVFYEPQYFFVDGEAAGGTLPPAPFRSRANIVVGAATQRILLRLVNAGIENHAPMLNGARFTLVAEDGNPYSAPNALHPQYSSLLAAGKTLDVLMTPATGGTFALVDRHRGLANSGGGAGGGNSSGMLVNLVIAP